MTESQKPAQQQRLPSPNGMVYLIILVGIIFLTVGFATRGPPSSPYNYLDLTINTIVALLIIIVGYLMYRKNKRGDLYSFKYEYVMLVLGIITFLLYSHFYGTPWIQYLHLYILPISVPGNPFYIHGYWLRDQLSATSYTSGILIIVLTLAEMYIVKQQRKQKL